ATVRGRVRRARSPFHGWPPRRARTDAAGRSCPPRQGRTRTTATRPPRPGAPLRSGPSRRRGRRSTSRAALPVARRSVPGAGPSPSGDAPCARLTPKSRSRAIVAIERVTSTQTGAERNGQGKPWDPLIARPLLELDEEAREGAAASAFPAIADYAF